MDTPTEFGMFVVIRKLGEGGMGVVYLAEDAKQKRQVAIKTMRPELASEKANRDRFDREARAATAVEHESIVPVLEVGEAADGTPFIVMPYLKGEPLDARLKREPVSPLWLLLKVAREVAEGLAAAHAAGLIHRDIKPANIWLDGDPSSPSQVLQVKQCKILDFGLVRSMSEDDAQLTKTGATIGTPAYMPPEQARGAKVDHRTDLYSLGATLYRMAAGQLPFNAPNPMALLYAIMYETPRPLRDLNPQMPPGVVGMIELLMQKESDNRPDSARDVVVAFRQFTERSPSKTPSAEPAAAPLPKPPDVAPLTPSSSQPPSTPRSKSKVRGVVQAKVNRQVLPPDDNVPVKEAGSLLDEYLMPPVRSLAIYLPILIVHCFGLIVSSKRFGPPTVAIIFLDAAITLLLISPALRFPDRRNIFHASIFIIFSLLAIWLPFWLTKK